MMFPIHIEKPGEAYIELPEGQIRVRYELHENESYGGTQKGWYFDGEPECFVQVLDTWMAVSTDEVRRGLGMDDYEFERYIIEAQEAWGKAL